jgi:hypothetical protein
MALNTVKINFFISSAGLWPPLPHRLLHKQIFINCNDTEFGLKNVFNLIVGASLCCRPFKNLSATLAQILVVEVVSTFLW